MSNVSDTMHATGFIFLASAAIADALPPDPIQFTYANDEMKVDGRLEEDAWGAAAPLRQFFEVSPGNVAVPVVSTEARFVYDDKNIYVGIRAYDSNPDAIRSALVRRDQVLADQDYVEVLLDPLSARHSAFMFRTNSKGVVTDGQYDEQTQTRDYAPDLNFDAKTTVDSQGWTAELRIPLSTLRFEVDADQSWSFVIYRNFPREKTLLIASSPIPRAANCVLCFAHRVNGVVLPPPHKPLYITPQATYARASSDTWNTTNRARVGVDMKWQIKPDTVVDLTLAPDFSQIEADDLQLTANTKFPLSVLEKRPFFLESADLLTTPILAAYTRAFTDPDGGARMTRRNNTYEYTALLLRDAGGGTVIEPGAIASQSAPQDFESTGFVGRYKYHLRDLSLGALATARFNDDGSRNQVYGIDTQLSLSTSDKITAQFLQSRTVEPNRTDLLPGWNGERLTGAAGALRWEHSVDAWYSYVNYENYSHSFRAWNGFVSQVGTSTLTVTGSYYFYPQHSLLTRFGPTVSFTSIEEAGGARLGRTFSPGLSLRGAGNTYLTLSWSPRAQDTTRAGLRSYDSYSLGLQTTPVEWMPQATLSLTAGDTLDTVTGEIGDGVYLQATLPLRLFSRFELITSLGYQSLDSRRDGVEPKRVFTQRTTQVNAIWHFNSRLYAQALYQSSTFEAPGAALRFESRLNSVLLSYQTNWQTRYYFGFRRSENSESAHEMFAKLSYVLAK